MNLCRPVGFKPYVCVQLLRSLWESVMLGWVAISADDFAHDNFPALEQGAMDDLTDFGVSTA